tara:strand:- start:589 stop:762 length:174 start_codon:yes stop_codon:yes gene_type:complete
MFSKCAACDQRNATVYDSEADDMYCADCHSQKIYDDEIENIHALEDLYEAQNEMPSL